MPDLGQPALTVSDSVKPFLPTVVTGVFFDATFTHHVLLGYARTVGMDFAEL